MSILKKILLLEKGEVSNILNQKIENPETGRKIKVKTALGYDDDEPVKKKAQALVKKKGKENNSSLFFIFLIEATEYFFYIFLIHMF